MLTKAIVGRLHFDLENALFDEIAAVRKDDPFVTINVVAGSNILCAHLRKRLMQRAGGFFNVRFLTFADLVSHLSAVGPAEHRASVPGFADTVIAREIVDSSLLPTCFKEVAGTRGFTGMLLSTFNDLAEGSCMAETARNLLGDSSSRAGLSERVKGLLSLYASYRERLESRGSDLHTRFENAREAVRDCAFERPFLAYGFYDFNEMQWRLVKALAESCGVTLFVPWREGDESYRFVSRTIALLADSGFDLVRLNGSGAREEPECVRLLSAPGKEEEVREIVRRILRLVTERGIRFGEVGILLSSHETYAPLVCEILEEAGIPYFASGGSTLEQYPAARAVLHLGALLGGRIERRALVEFLVSAPLRVESEPPPAVDGGAGKRFDPFQMWVRTSAETGMMGIGGWLEENDALSRTLEQKLKRKEAGARDDETRDALWSTQLVGGVLKKIVMVREQVTGKSTWTGFSTILVDLVRDIFEPSDGTDVVCGVIGGLAVLDDVSSRVSFGSFSTVLESALTVPTRSRGRFAHDGVNVLSLGQARGVSFKAVFMPGLSERDIPGKVVQDPFLMDHERIRLNDMSGGTVKLSEKSGRIEEEALLFSLSLDAARAELVCSYPRVEEGTGKQMIPSLFLRFVKGYTYEGDCEEPLICERLSRHGTGGRGTEPVSEYEYDFLQVSGFRDGGGFLPLSPSFARAAALINARWGKKTFTPYDGVFASPVALRELGKLLDEAGRRFSPTSMETYAGCPFAYLLSKLLGIEPTEEPERLITITPLQRGILVHRILALLYGELQKNRLLPLDESIAGEAHVVAERIAFAAMEEFSKTEPVGLPVFWEMEKRMIIEAVRLLLDEELGEGDECIPTYFEKTFGGKGDPIQIPFVHGGRTVCFHGRIDRVDVGPQQRFRVIDFKTGRLDSKDQDLAGGSNLQLPIYLLAASRILEKEIRFGEALYRRVGVSTGKRTVRFSGELWDQTETALARIIDVITRGIENGVFFAPALAHACAFCDMRPACPSERSGIFEAKALYDARSIDYLAMRGLVEVNDEE